MNVAIGVGTPQNRLYKVRRRMNDLRLFFLHYNVQSVS